MADEYKIDYKDKRFTEVNSDKNAAIKESDKTYDKMLNDADSYYQKQIDAAKNYGEEQRANQQALTDQAIKEIEQNKEKARKDYLDEQSGAYTDWQRQSNQYGANAEQQASIGVGNSGYSESSQVAMYNQYQNRVTTARESYLTAVQNYDNSIANARLQNNSLLAEIAYNTLQKSLELSLQGFQYKNQLLLDKVKTKRDLENTYYQRYQDVLSQINTEKSMTEQIRQYNESIALEREKLKEQQRQFDKQMAASSRKGSGGKGSYSGNYNNTSIYGDLDDDTDPGGEPENSGTEVSPKDIIDLGHGPVSDNYVKDLVASGQAHVNPTTGNLISGPGQTEIPRNSTEYMIWKNAGKVK